MKAGGLPAQGPAQGAADKPAIAVVGASARLLVRAAVDEGLEAYALDLFGDADTRALALGWWYVGRPACGAIDPAQLRAALQAAQAGNELSAMTNQQLMQIEAMLVAQHRAEALEEARKLAEAERGRARLQTFLGTGE